MRELEKEHDSIKEITRSYTSDLYNTVTNYDSSYSDSAAAHNAEFAAATIHPLTAHPHLRALNRTCPSRHLRMAPCRAALLRWLRFRPPRRIRRLRNIRSIVSTEKEPI